MANTLTKEDLQEIQRYLEYAERYQKGWYFAFKKRTAQLPEDLSDERYVAALIEFRAGFLEFLSSNPDIQAHMLHESIPSNLKQLIQDKAKHDAQVALEKEERANLIKRLSEQGISQKEQQELLESLSAQFPSLLANSASPKEFRKRIEQQLTNSIHTSKAIAAEKKLTAIEAARQAITETPMPRSGIALPLYAEEIIRQTTLTKAVNKDRFVELLLELTETGEPAMAASVATKVANAELVTEAVLDLPKNQPVEFFIQQLPPLSRAIILSLPKSIQTGLVREVFAKSWQKELELATQHFGEKVVSDPVFLKYVQEGNNAMQKQQPGGVVAARGFVDDLVFQIFAPPATEAASAYLEYARFRALYPNEPYLGSSVKPGSRPEISFDNFFLLSALSETQEVFSFTKNAAGDLVIQLARDEILEKLAPRLGFAVAAGKGGAVALTARLIPAAAGGPVGVAIGLATVLGGPIATKITNAVSGFVGAVLGGRVGPWNNWIGGAQSFVREAFGGKFTEGKQDQRIQAVALAMIFVAFGATFLVAVTKNTATEGAIAQTGGYGGGPFGDAQTILSCPITDPACICDPSDPTRDCRWPTDHGCVTQGPENPGQPNSTHDFLNAVDINAGRNVIIKATHPGTVMGCGGDGGIYERDFAYGEFASGSPAGYGNAVEILHTNGSYSTLYGHLETLFVSPCDTVTQGQAIGTADDTGYSTGDHLHYEMRRTNQSINTILPSPIDNCGFLQGMCNKTVCW